MTPEQEEALAHWMAEAIAAWWRAEHPAPPMPPRADVPAPMTEEALRRLPRYRPGGKRPRRRRDPEDE